MAYKLEQNRVLSESPDAAGEAQHEHDGAHHHEEPHGVEAPQVGDGRQVGQHSLGEGKAVSWWYHKDTTDGIQRPLSKSDTRNVTFHRFVKGGIH